MSGYEITSPYERPRGLICTCAVLYGRGRCPLHHGPLRDRTDALLDQLDAGRERRERMVDNAIRRGRATFDRSSRVCEQEAGRG